MSDPQPSRWGRAAVLVPALVVAACAVAATAHGGYEVAVASQVPPSIGWLYPVSADGLALVAYAATHRFSQRSARTYAWTVVVLAAALSGLAQAVYLASGPALDTSPVLRFGVGAWPAVAGAVAAHLVYLLARRPTASALEGVLESSDGVTATQDATTQSATRNVEPERAPLHSVPNAVPTPAAGIPAVKAVSPARTRQATSSARVAEPATEVLDKVRDAVAAGTGRGVLARELGVKPHVARALIDQVKASQ